MRTARRPTVVAVVADALCLLIFVIAGRQSHGLDNAPGWLLVVLWPIAVAWFAAAMLVGLYAATARGRWRLAATILLGVGLGLVVRIAVTHRDTPVAFALVAFGFVTLTTVGWRLVAAALPRVLARGRR